MISGYWDCTLFFGIDSPGQMGKKSRMVFTQTDIDRFMREALKEGRKALPECLPNPPVGCVLVRSGEIIARGYTQPPFEHHAEPAALNQLEGDLTDVAAFVTLEPCAFHQRTPSCAKEMIARRLGEVYVAMQDPHPRNRGKGIAMLKQAGMNVVTGVLREKAEADLGSYVWSPEKNELFEPDTSETK